MKTAAGPLRASKCSRLVGLLAAWLPLVAAAGDCAEARPERFSEFFARFAATADFALGRTVLPLQTERWSEDPGFDDAIDTTEVWVSRDDYARRPSLEVQRQSAGLSTQIRSLTATTATVELHDPKHGPVQGLRFRLEAGCWKLWRIDEFGVW